MMATTTHKHAVKNESGPYCFDHCVAPQRCNAASHGNVVWIQTCRCGARREVASNQGSVEAGPWQKGSR